MRSTIHQCVAWAGLIGLLIAHHDFWRGPREHLLWNWLPAELGYRLLWIAAALLYLLYFCRKVWRSEPES